MPSLAGLKAFEATARQQNYSAAARELNVTDAAIRQHIRGLENFFGRSLVVRSGRGVALTANGTRLAAAVTSGFLTLQTGIEALRKDEETRPLKIALTPAFAENWLMPRLGLFWAEHPEIEIELSPSLKLADLKDGGFDMAIRYGRGIWPGYHSELLASAEYVVVATGAFLADRKFKSLAELGKLPWLFEASRTEHQLWAEERGIDFHAGQNKFYPTNSLVLSAARAGYGLSLQAYALVERDLEDGRLIKVFSEDPGTLAYYLVTRRERHKKLVTFAEWLKENA
ncbi:LysR family transcriptional regulator [Pelagibius sp. Alg239-R121]|uniref:LysR family transcriptional regulator n=1 Tax=Pelagibius sp. Alg239-R121 TaxID=2993448 RepID=UPI0024A71D8B|nr:LysR family transcriptional regulator [Pelagibius sp. Alg239-R121]